MMTGAANTAAMTGGLPMMADARNVMLNSWMRRMMVIDEKALEAAAESMWRNHYNYGPGSIGAALVKHWINVDGVSRHEYLADARACVQAYLGALDAARPQNGCE